MKPKLLLTHTCRFPRLYWILKTLCIEVLDPHALPAACVSAVGEEDPRQ